MGEEQVNLWGKVVTLLEFAIEGVEKLDNNTAFMGIGGFPGVKPTLWGSSLCDWTALESNLQLFSGKSNVFGSASAKGGGLKNIG